MRGLIAASVALFCVFAQSRPARADILYLDMDDSPDEIAAAQDAATLRGEKVIIFPARTPDQQKVLDQIHALEVQKNTILNKELNDYRIMDSYRDQLARENAKPTPDPAKVALLQQKISDEMNLEFTDAGNVEPQTDAISQQEAALNNTVTVTLTELQQLVASYQANNAQITAIIFSGHHDFESFTGILGTIAKADVAQTFASAPSVFAGVKAIYGMGCYSTTAAEAEYWAKAIPSVELLAGYDAGAPLSYYPANTGFLKGVLAEEANLRAFSSNPLLQHDLAGFKQAVHSLPMWGIANTAVCSRDLCVGLNMGAVDLTVATNLCTQRDYQALSEAYTRYQTVLASADPSVESIPCDGQNSWLRTFYTSLRNHQHCAVDINALQADYEMITTNLDGVVRLIDFRQVYANFRNYFKADLDRVTALVAACSAPAPAANPPVAPAANPSPTPSSVPSPAPSANPSPAPDAANPPVAPAANPPAAPVNPLAGIIPAEVLENATVSCTAPPDLPITGPAVTRAAIMNFTNAGLEAIAFNCSQLAPADQALLAGVTMLYRNMMQNLTCIPLSWVNPQVAGRPLEAPDLSCAAPGYTIGANGLLTQPQ